MFVTIIADKYKGRRGYKGAPLELPAGRFSMEDALERARVPEGGGYEPVSYTHLDVYKRQIVLHIM